jgi:hypothetical protein
VGFAGMRRGEWRKKRIGGWGHLLDLEWWFVGLDWFYFGVLGGLWVRCGWSGGVSGFAWQSQSAGVVVWAGGRTLVRRERCAMAVDLYSFRCLEPCGGARLTPWGWARTMRAPCGSPVRGSSAWKGSSAG